MLRLSSILATVMTSTAINGSLAAPQRRERYRAPLPHQRAVLDVLEERNASEVRTPAKRHQPKRKPQRPNRAQRRANQ